MFAFAQQPKKKRELNLFKNQSHRSVIDNQIYIVRRSFPCETILCWFQIVLHQPKIVAAVPGCLVVAAHFINIH